MQNVTISTDTSQEKSVGQTTFLDPGPEAFFETLEKDIRVFTRNLIVRTIRDEFDQFIGAESYERAEDRKDYRNGIRYRNFETRFGNMEDIPIPRTRNRCFQSKLFLRWRRRENKITRLLASLFLYGISTRKVKTISKSLWGKEYSASTVSRSNRILQEEYLKWVHRRIERPVVYLFLDAVNLKLRRHWVSKEALLCAIGINDKGEKEFLGFLLGGRESTQSWETLLEQLLARGLSIEHLKLATVDGNPGLLRAIDTLLSGIPIQRCIVHKIWNVIGKCPRNLKGLVPAEMKGIFYATNHADALERFQAFKGRWQNQIPVVVECVEKDLNTVFSFYAFPYRHWPLIRSTNVIERAFKEFRRRIKVMETFPNEASCLRIMFSLAKMLNENWKYKPVKNFL